jgi:protein TonB
MPEPAPPVIEPRRELVPERIPSDRSGLSLSGPPPEASSPGPASGFPRAGSAGPSLRDQIAGLGSGLTADAGGAARQTINLDDRQPRFLDYLARLKQRIQQEWSYPEEARRVGMGGELVLVFTLNRAGSLTYIRLVQSSGFPTLDNEALRAVKTAAPYDPFPRQMGDEPWNISAIFRYQSPHLYRRN